MSIIASTRKLIASTWLVTIILVSSHPAVAHTCSKDEPARRSEAGMIDLGDAARKAIPSVSNGPDGEDGNDRSPDGMLPSRLGLAPVKICFADIFVTEGAQDKPRDRLPKSLTSRERAEIWRSLARQAGKTSVPAGLQVGEVAPTTMHLESFARDLRKKIPALGLYSYALLHNQVLIIDPRSKRIVSIVTE